jgi:hypothetical protein
MTMLPTPLRLLVAATIALASGLLLPGTVIPAPTAIAPSLVLAVFVLLCFFLRCMSVRATLCLVVVVGSVPVLAAAYGLSFHTPVAESLGLSVSTFVEHPRLLAVFFAAPLAVGLILHVLLSRLSLHHSSQ